MIFILFLLIIVLVFFKGITGYFISVDKDSLDESRNYTYIKAICNSSNYCQYYNIVCDGNSVVEMNPITGAAIQFEGYWQDRRTDADRLCE